MSRYIGNYLRVPSLEPQQSSAPGIWSINEQLNYQRANVWPPARDPYYNQTVLHLSGDVAATRETNPVTQPRTFLSDASPNNFLLTPNGDVSARSFNPYLNNYSAFFDGTGDYVTVSGGMPSGQGTAFTLECWVYLSNLNDYRTITRSSGGGTLDFGIQSSGQVSLANTGVIAIATTPTGSVQAGVWTHIALTRTVGNLYTIYVNGTAYATGSNSTSMTANTTIGLHQSTASQYFSGYMTNFRVCNALVYSGQFTPSSLPLSATSQGATSCQLLCFQSNRFIDNSGNSRTVTPSGNVAVAQNSPFVEYDTTSGSGYFKAGTTDYLTSSSSTAFAFGTGDWTVESWIYLTAYSSGTEGRWWLPSAGGDNIDILGTSGNSGKLFYYNGSSGITATNAIPLNQWTHIAVTRVAGTVNFYLNGALNGGGSISSPNKTSAVVTYVGGYPSAQSIVGYISDFRVVKGTAVYTGAFVPPSMGLLKSSGAESAVAYTNTNNVNTTFASSATSLLTLQTRAPANNQGILDTSPNSFVVTRNGNVAQGSFSPFNSTGWSVAVNGGSGYISYANNSNWNLGADFCVEAFVYLSSGTDTNRSIVSRHAYGVDAQWEFIISSNNKVCFVFWNQAVNLAQSLESDSTVNLGQWYHVAGGIVGSSIFVCLNGVYKSTALTVTPGTSYSKAIHIGTNLTTNQYEMTGYISDVRIVRGSPVYTANYTVPTGPLTAITNTQLLTCQGRNFKDYSNNNLTATINGTASIQPFYRLQPTQAYVASQLGGSAYFDGSNDYLSVAQTTQTDLGANNFTLEMWIYFTGLNNATGVNVTGKWNSTSQWILQYRGPGLDSVANQHWRFYFNSTTGFDFTESSTTSVTTNTWYHIAMVRNGSNWNFYRDGVQIGSTGSSSATVTATSDTLTIGTAQNVANIIQGYISNYRLVIGTALYTSNFPIPTAPPTAIPNTSLLLNFTNGGIVDATGKNNLETVANSGVQTSIIDPFGSRTGLMYLNGSSYFYEPYTQLMNQLNGNFTIECWIYPTVTSTRRIFAGSVSSGGSENWFWEITSGNKLAFVWTNTTPTAFTATSTASISPNTWTYIAVVKNGGTITQYINGSADGTSSPTGTYRNLSNGFAIGRGGDYNSLYFTGYVDEFRMTIGQARTITASPTGPFPLA